MIRIYADFSTRDQLDRLVLTIPGSQPDIEKNSDRLTSGLRVVLYQPGELEVEATLVFDRGWLGIPDWNTIKYYEGADPKRVGN